MNQDITAEQSRLMTGGKRGPRLVSEMEQVENFVLTYNGDGTVASMIKDHIRSDGTHWRKTLLFSYDPVIGKMSGKTETLELIP